jgi:hypothetical protein
MLRSHVPIETFLEQDCLINWQLLEVPLEGRMVIAAPAALGVQLHK